jgi:hypothetical protein
MGAEKCVGPHVKCPLLLPDFEKNWNMLINFSETAPIPYFIYT